MTEERATYDAGGEQPDAKTVLAHCWTPDSHDPKGKRMICQACEWEKPAHDDWCPYGALAASQARVEALEELVGAERDLPLKIEPDYDDRHYTEKHERARLARLAADMPLAAGEVKHE
jgi:hypothetical protein